MTVAQLLKNGVPVDAVPLTPTDRAAPVGDGTSFPKENNPSLNLKNSGEVVNALGNVVGATSINMQLGNVSTATATGAVTWSFTRRPQARPAP
jgi:hypothetical protein